MSYIKEKEYDLYYEYIKCEELETEIRAIEEVLISPLESDMYDFA